MNNYLPDKNNDGLMFFRLDEFDCQETGENDMKSHFLFNMDSLRYACGFPFVITSGYRSPRHSIEQAKPTPGTHAQGIAADIAVSGGRQRYKIVQEALKLGFTGIGVAKGFIHVDMREGEPVMWNY